MRRGARGAVAAAAVRGRCESDLQLCAQVLQGTLQSRHKLAAGGEQNREIFTSNLLSTNSPQKELSSSNKKLSSAKEFSWSELLINTNSPQQGIIHELSSSKRHLLA